MDTKNVYRMKYLVGDREFRCDVLAHSIADAEDIILKWVLDTTCSNIIVTSAKLILEGVRCRQ